MELALILPVLAMLVFGMIQFGQGYSARVQLLGAVREGARTAALGGSEADVLDRIKEVAQAGLDEAAIQFVTAPELCDDPSPPPDADAEITISYPFSYSVPFLADGTIDIKVTGVMRCVTAG